MAMMVLTVHHECCCNLDPCGYRMGDLSRDHLLLTRWLHSSWQLRTACEHRAKAIKGGSIPARNLQNIDGVSDFDSAAVYVL